MNVLRIGVHRVLESQNRLAAAALAPGDNCAVIVSHRHRFIFAAVPKTGTHSVRRALREHLGPNDLEQVGLFVNKRFPFPELAAIQHGHISLQQVRPCLGEDAFGSYFKFAFVRNPFDRFVSYCAFMTRGNGAFQARPQQVMREVLFRVRPMEHVLFRPQHTFLVDADGAMLTDFVGRVETMEASFDAMCARIGIPSTVLEQANSSAHADYRSYYDPQLIAGVTDLYRGDLERFDYEF